ncbi:MAG: hypothetical protein Q4G24_06480 [Paracoccus sp. (in: a-proteobacteria)]|uniref:S8 family serine peptidase n=1 Tax=Paracoccus sp. TaxID=267 RepID=UPI0026E0E40E|nr:hypothetical protein [Paracoccus sp. (in: a-proteobacteria)]MDO5621098.1 hypothetical protein [Paracoccus sp. (in: a-proteobacteria)]
MRALALCAMLLACGPQDAAAPPLNLIVYREAGAAQAVQDAAAGLDGRVIYDLSNVGATVVAFPSEAALKRAQSALARLPGVFGVNRDSVVQLD